jgi:hypothetical protein
VTVGAFCTLAGVSALWANFTSAVGHRKPDTGIIG